MALDHLTGIKLLISIDFGTTRTGYSFVFVDQVIDDKVGFEYFSKSFTSKRFQNQYKDLSDILLPDGPIDFEHIQYAQDTALGDRQERRAFFGFDAYERFLGKRDYHPDKALYFSRYKLDLANGNSDPVSTSLIGGDGREGEQCSTIDLVALILRYHGQRALADAFGSSFGGEISDDQIRWGITVPAIWDKAAIDMMQTAAERSGLARDPDDLARRFLFITEPLAATFAVLRDKREINERLFPGDNFMIVDCGGGTIDTTVIGVGDGGEFEIIDFGDGVKRGGSFLNDAILDRFWEYFPGDDVSRRAHQGYLEFLTAIETAKVGYRIGDEEIVVRIEAALVTDLSRQYPDHWERFTRSDNHFSPLPGVNDFQICAAEYIDMESRIYADIKVVLDKVVARLDEIPTYMLLVGGFSASQSLQEFIKDSYKAQSSIVIPRRPEKAIVDGTLSYILFPERLKLRLQCSYGIEVIEPFDSRYHPRDRRIVDMAGVEFCGGCFRSFLIKGGRVPIGSRHSVKRALRIIGTGAWPSTVDIEEQVLMSREGDVSYVDEDGVRAVANLDGGSMHVNNGKHPEYEMFFEFGALVTIGITNPDTGRVVKESFSPIINLSRE